MSSLPPPREPPDDADEQYRRASLQDPSRPGEATRRSILWHAERLAAERARRGTLSRWLSLGGLTPGWRPAIAGTVAAVIIVGVVVAPQFLAPQAPIGDEPPSATAPRQAPPPAALRPAAAQAPAPVNAPMAMNAPRAAKTPEQGAVQQVVVTGSANRSPQGLASAPLAALPESPDEKASEPAAAPAPAMAAARAAPRQLPDARGDPQALRQAAADGDLTSLGAQLAAGGDIDARDADGRTALMLATLNGRTDAVSLLLAHGADPRAADAHGTTPMQAAVAAGERDIVTELRRYGAR
jgi:hypothetical protein